MKFHVACGPYHAFFDPVARAYFGPAHASYCLVNEGGVAVAILDYESDRVQRRLFARGITEEEKEAFRAQCAKHFAETPRWNASAACLVLPPQ